MSRARLSPRSTTEPSAPWRLRRRPRALVARSVALFVVAALFEIGGAWLVWRVVREHGGWLWAGAGARVLGPPPARGFAATLRPDAR